MAAYRLIARLPTGRGSPVVTLRLFRQHASMTGGKAKRGFAAFGAAALLGHFTGALYGFEHGVSPTVARASFSWLRWGGHTSLDAVESAANGLRLALSGSSDQKLAARAACVAINKAESESGRRDLTASEIYAQLPAGYENVPGVRLAVNNIAGKLIGIRDFRTVYLRACLG